jgi:hypothetical protein
MHTDNGSSPSKQQRNETLVQNLVNGLVNA